MSDLLRAYSRDARPVRRTYSSQHEADVHDWNRQGVDDDGVHFKMKEFYEFLDTNDEYRPSRRHKLEHPSYGAGSSEVIDLRKSRRDLPSAGQIIWDDIGDSEVVDSLSWSQSDVEREIESWDQRLKENELKCQRTIAWDDGDMIRFDEPRDAYMPRRTSSTGPSFHDGRGRSPKGGRKRKDAERRFNVQSSEALMPRHHYRDVRESRRKRDEGLPETVPAKPAQFDALRTMDIEPAPIEGEPHGPESDCRCPCDHTYSSYKQVR